MTQLKLGTRRSLLAWAQSSQIAREVERLNPGVSVELVGIDTRGDKIVDVSLRNIVGKEFFVAELDDALRSGRVDFSVHSMKDLSLDRPEEFCLAAVPKRENPRDVALFGPHALKRMRRGEKVRIGTSSPRRLENGPGFFDRALPQPHGPVEFVEIRGNVNTRLGRVLEEVASERYLDGVILAFAGLIRLWKDEAGRTELSRLLQGVRWMVLPLRECPAAPAQGALAVECRADDTVTRKILSRLHDPSTAERVRRERALLAAWGGGCHQRFGATSIETGELGSILYVRGAKSDGEPVDSVEWHGPRDPLTAPARAEECWDGHHWRARHDGVQPIEGLSPREFPGEPVFVAHSRAVPETWATGLREARIWTSGVASWSRLAQLGLWVEGCAEGLGFDELAPALAEGVLRLPELSRWSVLTHDSAHEGWESGRALGEIIATYRAPGVAEPGSETDAEARRQVSAAKHLYWSSGSQFDALRSYVRPDALHACGAGKTARHLRSRGIDPTVFPSVEEWKKWLGIQNPAT